MGKNKVEFTYILLIKLSCFIRFLFSIVPPTSNHFCLYFWVKQDTSFFVESKCFFSNYYFCLFFFSAKNKKTMKISRLNIFWTELPNATKTLSMAMPFLELVLFKCLTLILFCLLINYLSENCLIFSKNFHFTYFLIFYKISNVYNCFFFWKLLDFI